MLGRWLVVLLGMGALAAALLALSWPLLPVAFLVGSLLGGIALRGLRPRPG